MANASWHCEITYPGPVAASTQHWMERIRHRLIKDFGARTSRAEVVACVERARRDLDPPSPAALPELVERLARVRLHVQAGRLG